MGCEGTGLKKTLLGTTQLFLPQVITLWGVILYLHFHVSVSVRAEGAQQDWDPRYTGWGTH